jgi:hypothetical protein
LSWDREFAKPCDFVFKNLRVFWLSSIGIIPLPALWLASHSFAFLIGVQILSGAIWSAYDLRQPAGNRLPKVLNRCRERPPWRSGFSVTHGTPRRAFPTAAGSFLPAGCLTTLLLFFETIPSEKRVGALTVFNLANAAAIVAGSAVGAILLACFDASRDAYLALFVISTVARAAALVLLVRMPRIVVLHSTALPSETIRPLPPRPVRPLRPSGTAHLPGLHWPQGSVSAAVTAPAETWPE